MNSTMWTQLQIQIVVLVVTWCSLHDHYFLANATTAPEDDYSLSSQNHKSLVVAMGCFWCGEEAFEHYGPGVVEAVSGYSGDVSKRNPTYRDHGEHYEVVLVEYDPTKSSYETLLVYFWRNIDPFNGNGQFCDNGSSYRPALFYDGEEEMAIAQKVFAQVLKEYPSWDEGTIKVESLERVTFWKAETYHQNYYIKNPGDYGYYKNACGRPRRLKEVWGEDVYACYHDLETTCFETVTNTSGEDVVLAINYKDTPEIDPSLLPKKAVYAISALCAFVVVIVFLVLFKNMKKTPVNIKH